MTVRQCSSCGGFCKKSGCERENVQPEPKQKQGVVIDKAAAKRIATSIGWEPKREWVGLTEQEENELWESTDSDWELMKRTEAKLKEKNT